MASVGVAAVTYVAACSGETDGGTIDKKDAQVDGPVGNLAPPVDASDASPDAAEDASQDAAKDQNIPDQVSLDVVANLVAPDGN